MILFESKFVFYCIFVSLGSLTKIITPILLQFQYACRKTLADSRPRIRGRFARNEEIEKSSQIAQWSHINAGEDEFDEDDENWANFLDAFSSNLIP